MTFPLKMEAVAKNSQIQETLFKIPLMHREVSYTPVDFFSLNVDATFRVTHSEFNHEELAFLRKLQLEQFLCDVPWGVLHMARAAEAINTIQEDTLKVIIKREHVPIYSKNWKSLFLIVFKLPTKRERGGEKWELKELFPSLKTI